MAAIRWPIAWGADGTYVRVDDAKRGGAYTCPECDWRFIPRQGPKTRWHFAHYFGADCSGEGSRHSVSKHLIAMVLAEPLDIELGPCVHDLPLEPPRIERVVPTEVAVEKGAGAYRPDIAFSVFWRDKERRVYVEVVDTHETSYEKAVALSGRYFDVTITHLSDDDIFDGTVVIDRFKRILTQHLINLDSPEWFGFLHSWVQRCNECHRPTRVAEDCDIYGDSFASSYYGSRHAGWREGWLEGAWKLQMPSVLLAAMKAHARMEWDDREDEWAYYNACTHCGADQEGSLRMEEALDDLDEQTGELTSSLTTEYWESDEPLKGYSTAKRRKGMRHFEHETPDEVRQAEWDSEDAHMLRKRASVGEDLRGKGTCIRCGRAIEYNPHLPLCLPCWRLWNVSPDKDDTVLAHCHSCGLSREISKWQPLCESCHTENPWH